MDKEEQVILVDLNDSVVGFMEKTKAHKEGKLHRAFSIFIFNEKGEMLLQKRALEKYHSGGLWSNACCSHPLPNENIKDALNRKLEQELGFICKLDKKFDFIYKANLNKGLVEYEFDHVFVGTYEGKIVPNPKEVETYRFISKKQLETDVTNNPELYTEWFKLIYNKF